MKSFIAYLIIFLICFVEDSHVFAQKKGKIQLEITRFKAGIYGATYRDRATNSTGFGEELAVSSLIYFPFQWSVDVAQNFNDTIDIKDEFNQRVFLIRPTAIVNVTEKGSFSTGGALQFSFLLGKQWYLEFLSGIVWAESPKNSNDGMDKGFNLTQGFYLSKPLHRHFTLSFGFNHVSSAHVFNTNTNHDQLVIGVKYIL